MGTKLGEVLPLVARRARLLTHSDASWIVSPVTDGDLVVSAVDGPGTEVLLGTALSAGTSRSAEVMRTGSPEMIDDLFTATNVPDAVVELNLGPGLYVPLVADERRLGTLVLGRLRGGARSARLTSPWRRCLQAQQRRPSSSPRFAQSWNAPGSLLKKSGSPATYTTRSSKTCSGSGCRYKPAAVVGYWAGR